MRRNFSKAVQRDALARAKGQCEAALPSGERCPCALQTGRYRFDHTIPDRIGGAATLSNCQVICVGCDRAKYPRDRLVIDRTRRIEERHAGITDPWRRPMPGGRTSPFKRLIGGGVASRATGERL
jgi:5-methylcytosine-specific restriction endonuclease McrA